MDDKNDENSVDMLSYVIDQLKQQGSSLDADLSQLHAAKLPEVPQITREADMDMDIIQKLLDTDQDINDGKFMYFALKVS